MLVWESSRYISVRLSECKNQSLFIYYNSCPNGRIEKHDINNSEAKILKERLIFWFHWQLKWKTQKNEGGGFSREKIGYGVFRFFFFQRWRLICRYSNVLWFVRRACRHLESPVNRLRGLWHVTKKMVLNDILLKKIILIPCIVLNARQRKAIKTNKIKARKINRPDIQILTNVILWNNWPFWPFNGKSYEFFHLFELKIE